MASETDSRPDGPLSWRDLFRALGETEQRITTDIAELRVSVIGITTDHESRLRVVESAQLLTMGKRQGVVATLGLGKTAFLMVMSAAGPIIGIAAFLVR